MKKGNQPLVSIIVPVYNAEKYLDKCINSLINQSYPYIEIILVNDGSTDNSSVLCQKWERLESQISVINKANGGVSSARNIGLKHSTGKYICFVDADDWMVDNAIEILVNNIENTKSDFCFGVAEAVGVINRERYGINSGQCIDKSNIEQLIQYTDILRTELGPWAKLYKKSIILQNNIFFPEDIRYGEDRIFIWRYLNHCHTLSSVPNTIYMYSQLNLTRACGRYYEKTNEWLYEAVSCYAALFDSSNHLKVQIVAMRQFDVCIRHYILHCDIITQDFVIEQIKRTNELFGFFLKTPQNNRIFSEIDRQLIPFYVEFFKNKDYIKLLQSLQASIKNKAFLEKHIVIRNILVRVKRFIVYNLLKKY